MKHEEYKDACFRKLFRLPKPEAGNEARRRMLERIDADLRKRRLSGGAVRFFAAAGGSLAAAALVLVLALPWSPHVAPRVRGAEKVYRPDERRMEEIAFHAAHEIAEREMQRKMCGNAVKAASDNGNVVAISYRED
jgi:hypothetical protein